jgi:hypothetical protein
MRWWNPIPALAFALGGILTPAALGQFWLVGPGIAGGGLGDPRALGGWSGRDRRESGRERRVHLDARGRAGLLPR